MSIRLVTGAIGSGKTSLVVHMLLTDKDLKDRTIYVDGVTDLKLPHETIPEGKSPKNWHEWLPEGAVLIVDEAQRYWRTRHPSSAVPEELQKLEVSRHTANDFIFITQHPRQIDVHIKSLVTQHFHINVTQLGVRKLSEWPSCKNPDSKQDMNEAIKKPFKLKKDAFEQYKSASEHLQLKRGKRKFLYIFVPVLICLLGVAVYSVFFMTGFNDTLNKKEKKETAVNVTNPLDMTNTALAPLSSEPVKIVGAQPEDYVPAISEKPETKPLYDNVRTVVNFEYPEICISSSDKCTCYSNQATVLDNIPEVFCRKFSEKGVFNPYKPRINSAQSNQPDKVT